MLLVLHALASSIRLLLIPSAGAGTDPFLLLDLQDTEIISMEIPGRPG